MLETSSNMDRFVYVFFLFFVQKKFIFVQKLGSLYQWVFIGVGGLSDKLFHKYVKRVGVSVLDVDILVESPVNNLLFC